MTKVYLRTIIAKAYSIVYWLWEFPVKKYLHVKVVRLKIFFLIFFSYATGLNNCHGERLQQLQQVAV